MFLQRARRSAEKPDFRAAIQIFAQNIRPPAEDLNVQWTPQIFSGKNNFSAELFDFCVAVLSFRQSVRRSAEDLNFRPDFSISTSCLRCAAELLKIRLLFYFSARFDFLPPERDPEAAKKEKPGQIPKRLRVDWIP